MVVAVRADNGSACENNTPGSSADGAAKTTADNSKESAIREAVRKKAWEKERERVLCGKGTRDWTIAQQEELIRTKHVTGFEGQHMLSAKKYPQFMADPDNIQFVTYAEHLHGCHRGDWKNPSSGWLDPNTGEMVPIVGDRVVPPPEIELTNKINPNNIADLILSGVKSGRDSNVAKSRKRIKNKS